MSDRGQVGRNSNTSRVFFALWPDDTARAKLHAEAGRLRQRLGGRATHPDTLHLTLVFIGDVRDDQIETMKQAASQVASAPIDISFDILGCWRHNHIAYRGMRAAPKALLQLVEQLSSCLVRAGIRFDARPYKPHITLVRKADCALFGNLAESARDGEENENPTLEPIRWPARDFVLVKSSLRAEGARYEQLGRWPLL